MIHVLLIDDLKEHQETVHCHCQPRVDWNDGVVVHNSYDKREIIEQANDVLGGADAFTENDYYIHKQEDDGSRNYGS